MALDSEIQRIRKNPEVWRPLAQRLFKYAAPGALNDDEADFLEGIPSRKGLEELSYRQAEFLLGIRDNCLPVSDYRGASVRYMVRFCYENHLDLEDEDRDWILELRQSGGVTVRRRDARRLHRLMRQLNEGFED